jgi:hypothetical protein
VAWASLGSGLRCHDPRCYDEESVHDDWRQCIGKVTDIDTYLRTDNPSVLLMERGSTSSGSHLWQFVLPMMRIENKKRGLDAQASLRANQF